MTVKATNYMVQQIFNGVIPVPRAVQVCVEDVDWAKQVDISINIVDAKGNVLAVIGREWVAKGGTITIPEIHRAFEFKVEV